MPDEKKEKKQDAHPVSDDAIFKVTKEIVVKFIEVGRLTPANFEETYNQVFATVRKSVRPE
ncbi:MAG: hypothetical protein M8357_10780 [Desulfobulbaceae bacterium]|nr:hypothetical protein [Desulfobulbaceae bacterium]